MLELFLFMYVDRDAFTYPVVDTPVAVVKYVSEDGAGVLSNGYKFCLEDWPCDD